MFYSHIRCCAEPVKQATRTVGFFSSHFAVPDTPPCEKWIVRAPVLRLSRIDFRNTNSSRKWTKSESVIGSSVPLQIRLSAFGRRSGLPETASTRRRLAGWSGRLSVSSACRYRAARPAVLLLQAGRGLVRVRPAAPRTRLWGARLHVFLHGVHHLGLNLDLFRTR